MAQIITFLAILASFSTLATSMRVVCYFASWTIYRQGRGKFAAADVDPHLCSHILYAFVGLNEDGTVWVMDDWEATGLNETRNLMELKKINPNLKVLLSMGGWNEGSQKYSSVAKDPAKRAKMVQSVMSYVQDHQFDGFDLDWEYPGQRGADPVNDPKNYVTLLGELKVALNAVGKVLSAAVSGGIASIQISYPDLRALSENLDMINVMAYDFHGDFEPFVGHHAPLFESHLDQTEEQKTLNVASGMQYWIDKGADPAKLNLGVGTYGRGFTLANPTNTSLYAPTIGGCRGGPYTGQDGILGYNEISEPAYKAYRYVWDDEQQVPHIIQGNQWIGFEDERSIKQKMIFAKLKHLGGIMVWSLDTDDFTGYGGAGKYPLLNAIKNNLS